MDLTELLKFVTKKEASDLHLKPGRPPLLRINGRLVPLKTDPLQPKEIEDMVLTILTPHQKEKLTANYAVDIGYGIQGLARFRGNIFLQRGSWSAVFRRIPFTIPGVEELHLPDVVQTFCDYPSGLVLVTGPTGSGKTTTLATMIDFVNIEHDGHIITIEDPIEYYHNHKKSLIMQREVGVDVPTFAEALRRALRQDPDVILVGEMRDLETIEAAVTAAETGHLVFGTLHTTGAVRTIDRIVDAFPTNQQEQIRTQLAGNLKSVISQALVPRKSGFGRIAAYEIMICTSAIQNLIRENKSYRITSAIQTGHKYGMNLLDEHLMALYRKGICRFEDCLSRAQVGDEFIAAAKALGIEEIPETSAGDF